MPVFNLVVDTAGFPQYIPITTVLKGHPMNASPKTLTPVSLPTEMTGCGPGAYSIHFYGDACGDVFPWDGRDAGALLSDDLDEAYAAGSADDRGALAAMEVRVLLVDAEGEAWLISHSPERTAMDDRCECCREEILRWWPSQRHDTKCERCLRRPKPKEPPVAPLTPRQHLERATRAPWD